MEAFLAGGPVMIVLTFLSVVALSLVLYSIHSLRTMHVSAEEWIDRAKESMNDLGNSDSASVQAGSLKAMIVVMSY